MREFIVTRDAFTFARHTQLHAADKAAEILISSLINDQQWNADGPELGFAKDVSAEMRADFCFLRGKMKTRRSIDSVAIDEGHGRHIDRCAGGGHFFRQGSAIEKAEGGTGVKFNVSHL